MWVTSLLAHCLADSMLLEYFTGLPLICSHVWSLWNIYSFISKHKLFSLKFAFVFLTIIIICYFEILSLYLCIARLTWNLLCEAQASLKLAIFLLLTGESWHYRGVPPCPVLFYEFTNIAHALGYSAVYLLLSCRGWFRCHKNTVWWQSVDYNPDLLKWWSPRVRALGARQWKSGPDWVSVKRTIEEKWSLGNSSQWIRREWQALHVLGLSICWTVILAVLALLS